MARLSAKKKGSSEVTHAALRIRSEDGATISSHRQVIEKHGQVMFAKIGKGLGSSFINQLNDQVEQSVPTYLFLATYEGPKQPYGYYRGDLLHVHQSLNEAQQTLVPSYLQYAIPEISTWFEIASISRLSQHETNRIYVLSSGRELASAISGTASLFKVGVKGIADMELVSDPAPSARQSDRLLDLDDELYGDEDSDFIESWLDSRDI